ncbi:MAG: hypothetical protein ACOCT0_06480 [Halobacteriota archaeon]
MKSGVNRRHLVLLVLLASTLFLAGCTEAVDFGTPEYHVDAQEESEASNETNTTDGNATDEANGDNESEIADVEGVDSGYVDVDFDAERERVVVQLRQEVPGERVEVDFGGTATARGYLYEPGDTLVLDTERLVARGEAEDGTRDLYADSGGEGGAGGFSGVEYGEEVLVTARAVDGDDDQVIFDNSEWSLEDRTLGDSDVEAGVDYLVDEGSEEFVIAYTSNVNADFVDVEITHDGRDVGYARLNSVGDEVRMISDTPFLETRGKAENLLATELEEELDEVHEDFLDDWEDEREDVKEDYREEIDEASATRHWDLREERDRKLNEINSERSDFEDELDRARSMGRSVEYADRLDDDYEAVDELPGWASGDVEDDLQSALSWADDQFYRPTSDDMFEVSVTAHIAPRTTSTGSEVRGGQQSPVSPFPAQLEMSSDGFVEVENASENNTSAAVDLGPTELGGSNESDVGEYADVDEDAVAREVRSLIEAERADRDRAEGLSADRALGDVAQEYADTLARNIDLQAHTGDVESDSLPSRASLRNRVERMSRNGATTCHKDSGDYPFSRGDEVDLTNDESGEVTRTGILTTTVSTASDRQTVRNYHLYDIVGDWHEGAENVAGVTPSEADEYDGSVEERVAAAAVDSWSGDRLQTYLSSSYDHNGIGVSSTDEGVVYVVNDLC